MLTKLQFARAPLSFVVFGLLALAACESATPPDTTVARGLTHDGAASGAQFAKGAPTMVPITDRETFEPQSGQIQCGAYGLLPAGYAGAGNMSHLGKVTSISTWQDCRVVSGRLVANGVATLTAANGDAINVKFTQTFTEFVPAQRTAFVLEPWTIIGGTGRFAGVTGSGRGSGTTTGAALHGEWEVIGTMTSPGVSKQSQLPSVAITQINQIVCDLAGCHATPANLSNVAGQVDVTLNVEPNGQAIASVQATLTCGAASITRTRTINTIAGEAIPPVTLSFNTAAFSHAGVVALHNGQCTLDALATTTSSTQSATVSQIVTLNNRDVAVVTVSSSTAATDPTNRLWIGGGPLTITALPIMYSGRAAVAATLGITGGTPTTGSVAASPTSQTLTSPVGGAFTATWTNGPTAPTVRGFAATNVTPVISISDASGATFTAINSVTVTGGATSNTPANFAFNLDEQKPAPGTFSVANNKDQNAFSSDGYAGAAFRFVADSAAGYRGPNATAGNQIANFDFGGVDKVSVEFQVRQTGTATAYLTVTHATVLAPTFAGILELRMITRDALGNADTTAAASTIKFGVDKSPPRTVVVSGPTSGSSTTAPGGNGLYILAAEDDLSGIGPMFVAQIRVFNGTPISVASANEGRVNTNVIAPGLNGVNTSGAASANPCVIGRFNATLAAAGANALPVSNLVGALIGYCTPVIYIMALGPTGLQLSSDLSGTDGQFTSSMILADLAGNMAIPIIRTVVMGGT